MKPSFKRQSAHSHSKQAGFSLVELSVALAIGSIVVLTAVSGVRGMQNNISSNAVMTQFTSMTGTASKLAYALSDWAIYDDTLGMAKSGVFDESNLGKDAARRIVEVRNAFGGLVWTKRNTVVVSGVPIGMAYWFTVTGVPNAACGSMVSAMSSKSIHIVVSAPVATAANVQTTGATPTNVVTGAEPKVNDGPINKDNIESSCSNNTNATKDIHFLTLI